MVRTDSSVVFAIRYSERVIGVRQKSDRGVSGGASEEVLWACYRRWRISDVL